MRKQTATEIQRHAAEAAPKTAITAPTTGGPFALDQNVINALPIVDSTVIEPLSYGHSLWGRTAKITVALPDDARRNYFLKVLSLGDLGRTMLEGEFESLNAIHLVSPTFAPEPHAWGCYSKDKNTYFLLTEFRDIGKQPPDPATFTARLAEMHQNSQSPTGKFGFHITTCIATLQQVTAWEDSWAVLFRKQMEDLIRQDIEKNGNWPEFKIICDLITSIVIPRLLEPLQSNGRSIKPCLTVGDIWDENTATDMRTGEPFVFDPGAMYAHNEYDLGNWRAPRHRLSSKSYIEGYKQRYLVSEPKEEWDARNLLYSLRYNLSPAIFIQGCNLRQVVFDDMTELCEMFCPKELREAKETLQEPGINAPVGAAKGNEEEEEEVDSRWR